MKKIISVVGARPNFMKVAPLHRAFQKHSQSIRHLIVHTGQHYDEAMSKVFFEELGLPNPDVYLGVGSGSHAQQTAKIMVEFEKVLEQEKPDLVVVVGDVNSTVACSLVSAKMNTPVAHVEAGLRSFDRTMPEEINRLLTDAIAEYLFVSEPSGIVNLKREGVDEKKMFLVGNVMIDSLVLYRARTKQSSILRDLNLARGRFTLVTLHRPSNVDEEVSLAKVFDVFAELGIRSTIVFPVHPRTRKMISKFKLQEKVDSIQNLKLLDPIGYLDFLALMEQAQLVITDSGGIQEETTYLGIPCLTIRKNTERPVTIEIGTNQLCGEDLSSVVEKSFDIFDGKIKKGKVPEFWDGKTSARIVKILGSKLSAS